MVEVEKTIDRLFYSSFKVDELRDLLWNLEVAAVNQRKSANFAFPDMVMDLDNKLNNKEFLTRSDFKVLIRGIVTTFAH